MLTSSHKTRWCLALRQSAARDGYAVHEAIDKLSLLEEALEELSDALRAEEITDRRLKPAS